MIDCFVLSNLCHLTWPRSVHARLKAMCDAGLAV